MNPQYSNLRSERAKLVGFCTLMLAAGAAFAVVAGPPRAPAAVPGLHDVLAVVSGSNVPLAPLALVLVDLAWLLWLWVFGSLCLELLLAVAEAIGHGAAWVRSVRVVVDRVSAPLARKAVAAAFAVQVVSRGVPVAAAQTIDPGESALVSEVRSATSAPVPTVDGEISISTYRVQTGDTLWSIAERAYGSGTAYRQVLEANLGRRMPDGQLFSAQGVIRPGWELVLPGAGQRLYVVQPAETLSAIAAITLGDKSRWPELFETNLGVATPDDLHRLTDPNVIWPGLRLRIPDKDTQAAVAEAPASDPVDMVAAAAPLAVMLAGTTPTAELPGGAALPEYAAPPPSPPLLRTPHALDPVVLEMADAPPSEADADSAGAPPAGTAADTDVSVPTPPWHADVPTTPLAVGGLGLVAIAGLAFGVGRIRRRLRPLPQEPESEVTVEGGFAEAQLAQDLTRGLHGVGFDPIASLVSQLEQFLLEYNLANVGVVAIRHGRSSTTITLRAGLAEQALLVDVAPVFAERLGAEVEAWVSADQDVLMRLVRLRRTRLLPSADAAQQSPCLVPLGVVYDRQVYSAAWNSLGHVLVVSLPGHGADTILTSLVATLTARRSPEQLRIWLLAAPRALPAPLFELPHLSRVVDASDAAALSLAAEELRMELDFRAAHPHSADLVIVIPELASLGEHAGTFGLLASHAAELGVRFVCATTSVDDASSNALTAQFGTRMVLRMQDEETSVALLGVADAAFLGGGGRLLLRLDGREPVELYGYQVSAEHLERLVRVMRSAYPTTQPAPVQPTTPPPPPAPTSLPETDDTADVPVPPPLRPEPETPTFQPDASTQVDVRRPPVEVTCFGGPRVLCAGFQVWPSTVSGDAKPWELLLYLACQPAEGVAKAEAVEALWPEDEEPEDAPHRFRQLRYRLRRLLLAAPGAPDSEGICLDRGTLRLDPHIVASDAQAFLAHVRRAKVTSGPEAVEHLEQARALYTGDLMEGPDARRYAWVVERDDSGVTLREHFRRLFQQATYRLAELNAASGALEASVDLYRELSDIDPADERVWLSLFRLHAQRGDRLALLREEHRMRETLRELTEEFGPTDAAEDGELSRETAREFQRLLASMRDREPATA